MVPRLPKIEINKSDLNALKALDPVLSKYIESTSKPERFFANSFFEAVVSTIIGQLISTKAAATIYSRLQKLIGEINVDNFLSVSKDKVIACGIYNKKYMQIYNIAISLESGILDFQELSLKSDKEIIEILTQYPGIGQWSAEMILLFGMKRKDVLAYSDFGIRSGIKIIYNLENLSKVEFNIIKKRLSPYGSLASLYFWQAHTKE